MARPSREVLRGRRRHRQGRDRAPPRSPGRHDQLFPQSHRVIPDLRGRKIEAGAETSFDLSEVQANYILDTRLRGLRRLEEMQLRRENDELARKARDRGIARDEAKQWKAIAAQIRELKKKYGPERRLGAPHEFWGAADIAMLISRER